MATADYFILPYQEFKDISANTSNVTLNTTDLFEIQNTSKTNIQVFFNSSQPSNSNEMITIEPKEFLSFQLQGSEKVWAYAPESSGSSLVLYKAL
jgi:hypothetical protein